MASVAHPEIVRLGVDGRRERDRKSGRPAGAAVWLWAVALGPAAFIGMSLAAERPHADGASPIYGVTVPDGYRQWELVAPSLEGDPLNELRAILGNELAMAAYRAGTLPFPDGAVLAKLAWKRVPSDEFDAASVPGAATTVQFMVKDSRRYAATGGWGFGRFIGGKPADEAQHETCFGCHEANVKDHDLVFTRLAP